MSSSLVITLVVAAATGWFAVLVVSALRSRGPEEVAPNLRPGITDDVLETSRIERAQQAAIFLSAFLAIGLPLYYLTENTRQESFVEQFHEESVVRGDHLVVEYACYSCHGPDGVGGVAAYVEKRSGVSVSWSAPSLNDIFYRYDREAIRYWITYGRGNTPMPPWGVAGGGPLNEQQVDDIINYLESVQVPQSEVAAEVEAVVASELTNLANADSAMSRVIIEQRQVIADMEHSPVMAPVAEALAARAADIEAAFSTGLDSDGDGISDAAETALTSLTLQAQQAFIPAGLSALAFDPANAQTNGPPDLGAAEQGIVVIESLIAEGIAPILEANLLAIQEALVLSGEDADGDGISDEAEGLIAGQFADAVTKMVPADLVVVDLDPTKAETSTGVSDLVSARRAVAALDTIALNLSIQAANLERTLQPAKDGLAFLLAAQQDRAWEFDFQSIADRVFDGDVSKAQRVVGIFNGYCARCHTSGYSAGLPLAQEAGSGGFGPALWDGRPTVQFLHDEDLRDFLIVGSVENQTYGVNGFGSGRMPGFGMILSEEDLGDLAAWLRSGDLTGFGGGVG